MIISCPSCGKPVPPESLNINTDLGKCPECLEVFQISKASANEKLPPVPAGSGITIGTAKEGLIKIKLPVKKFGKSDYMETATLILSYAFWLFMIFMLMDMNTNTIIPFIFIMIMILPTIKYTYKFLNSLDEDQEIIIEGDKISFYKNRPVRSKEYTFIINNITEFKNEKYVRLNPFKKRVYIRPSEMFALNWPVIPRVESPVKTIWFFEYAVTAEKEWIVKFLNVILNEYKKYNTLHSIHAQIVLHK
jgi:hypothetical protein